MKRCIFIAVVIAIATAVPAVAKELKEQERDDVLANGEVLWASSKSPLIIMRHRGKVFFCTFSVPAAFTDDPYAIESVCVDCH